MKIRRTFSLPNSEAKGWGILDLSQAFQIDVISREEHVMDDNNEPKKDEEGNFIYETIETIMVVFPFSHEKLIPVPQFESGKKGEGRRFKGYDQKLGWSSYYVLITEPEEIKKVKSWMEKECK